MKFYYISDLHLQSNTKKKLLPLFEKADTQDSYLILAGDISDLVDITSSYGSYIPFFRSVCNTFKKVFYVYGNHEFWNTPSEDIKIAEQLFDKIDNLVYTKYSEPVKLVTLEDNLKILMFSDWFKLKPDWMIRPRTNDPKYIRNFEEFSINYRESIDKALDKIERQDVDLVITHYLPHADSIPRRFRGCIHRDVNDYFNTNRFHSIEEKFNPKVWVHGHTHDSVDTVVNNCRILCNPYGTPYDSEVGTTLESFELG
jgi:UDP-2,3-diacylglucosamine pyrophosphatase LpxH